MTAPIESKARERAIYRVTLLGGAANLALLIFKFVAAILGRSSAMMADAVHSLSDFITDVIVLVFVRISSKPQDIDHDYGHGKYETLATAIIGLMLMGAGIGIMAEGIGKIVEFANGQELEAPGMIALVAALVSIVVKEIVYRITISTARRLKSTSVEANAWHHRSDALSSIGTAVGIGGAILLGSRWRVLDPIAAVVVSVFIIRVALQLIRPCIGELLERSLPPEQEQAILDTVAGIPEIQAPHNLRTRSIGPYAAVEMHVRLPGEMTVQQSHEITRELERRLRESLGQNTYLNIHVEPYKADNEK